MAASLKVVQSLKKINIFMNSRRALHPTNYLGGAFDMEFQKAQDRLKTLEDDPENETKLQIYALFKQATTGAVTTKRPGMMDFVGRAKWDAWKSVSELSEDEAQSKYINLITELAGSNSVQQPEVNTQKTSANASDGPKTLKLESRDGMSIIRFNRPKKKNAITVQMYDEITDALHAAGEDKNTSITVVTGNGDFYSSGNDLGNFMGVDSSGMEKMAKDAAVLLERFVSSFIDHPKPLIALVNGPAIGVAVTTLGLFDLVYASDRATFHTPFTSLGQSPEGCASVMFPRLMGTGKACEVMLFGKKLAATEAKDANLVTEVFPQHCFESETWHRVEKFAKLPKNSMRLSKQLIRGIDKDTLHAANDRECKLLIERWQSDECVQAIMDFFQQKSKI